MILEISKRGLLAAAEVAGIEESRPDGITSAEVLELFQGRGVKLSEATFRKYIQLGLLPTSRRVGTKGKYRGSKGVYPVSVVRRINLIKKLMEQGMTLEEIRDSFLSIQNDMELLNTAVERLFGHLSERIDLLHAQQTNTEEFLKEFRTCKKEAKTLYKKLEKLGSQLAAARPTEAERE